MLTVLPERARDVLVGRFGLGKDSVKLTLESIGKKYGITRERVRQIENYAIHSIKKADQFEKEKETFKRVIPPTEKKTGARMPEPKTTKRKK